MQLRSAFTCYGSLSARAGRKQGHGFVCCSESFKIVTSALQSAASARKNINVVATAAGCSKRSARIDPAVGYIGVLHLHQGAPEHKVDQTEPAKRVLNWFTAQHCRAETEGGATHMKAMAEEKARPRP